MGKIITLTEVGGKYMGPEKDTPCSINSDEIKNLKSPSGKQLGKTVVTLKDNKMLFVVETEDKIKKLISGDEDNNQNCLPFFEKLKRLFR